MDLDDLLDEGYDILEALQMLVEDNHPDLYDALLEGVESHDRAVRLYASLMLAELFHDVRALPGLHEALYDGDRHLRREAAEAVWEIGDADTASLIRALHFERQWVRESIVEALSFVGWFPEDANSEVSYRIATRGWRELIVLGEEAVPGLISALSDPDGTVRRGAVWTLGQIGDPRAVPFLIEMLKDASGDMFGIGERVCDVAADALVRIGTPEALTAVEKWRLASEA